MSTNKRKGRQTTETDSYSLSDKDVISALDLECQQLRNRALTAEVKLRAAERRIAELSEDTGDKKNG